MNSGRIVGSYALSPMQQGMLFHSLDQHESGVDVEQIVCSLEEELNVAGFVRAWAEVVAHHDILRSSFGIEGGGEPVQEVHDRAEIDCERLDWSALSRAEQEHQFRKLLDDDRVRGFDLGRPPLLRLALIRLAQRSWKVLWTFHHILLDGRSFPIVLREAFGRYEGIRDGCPFEPPRPRPYREYIEWLAGQDLASAESHWRAALKGFSAPTPIGTPRPSERGRGVHTLRLPEQTTTALRGFAETCGVTLNTLIQGAWAILLHRYSGEPEVVFGATRACRRSALEGAEDMVGLFINTLPVRVAVDEGRPLAEWLRALRTEQTGVRPVEHTPLSLVQGWSEVPRGTPLFDSIVVFENYLLDTALRSAGREWAARHFEYIGQTSLPVTLIAYADPSLLLRLEYYRNRLDDESAGRMLGHLGVLLEGMLAGAQQRLAELPMLTAAEERELLSRWGNAGTRSTTPTCIHDRFAAQAAATPDAVAVTFQDASLSYRELDRRANRMAHRLRAAGVGPDVLVGLCVERSLDMVAAILAILKAGGAYVPLDPAYPADRIAFMLEDAALPVLVTERALASRVPAGGARVLLLDELAAGSDEPPAPVSGVAPEHLAYVIYTSGSTGRPKGVCITHDNVGRLFDATEEWFHFGSEDVWTLFHSYAFDFSVWELWGALFYGGRVVVVPYLVSRSPEAFADLLESEQVTILNQTPSAFRQLMTAVLEGRGRDLALRMVVFGGEALDLGALRPWFARFGDQRPRLINMYGITETTVHVTYRPITLEDLDRGSGSVIGRPIPDLTIRLTDPSGHLVPIGVPGEIRVGGAGVARGYLNRPELSAARFPSDPYSPGPGARLYRSGDLARLLPTGDLEYLGRIDQQVKLRGFRIELGEIEALLSQHPAVRDAAVVLREDTPGSPRLVGYFVALESQADLAGALRDQLKRTLPDYMVPAVLMRLDVLPLTGNGKVDRRALPLPREDPRPGREYLAPSSSTEQILGDIWSKVLNLPQVGANDNFFELGGDSILMIQAITRARQAGIRLAPRDVFTHPVLADLARAAAELPEASAAGTSNRRPGSTLSRRDAEHLGKVYPGWSDAYPLSPMQQGLLYHYLAESRPGMYVVQVRFTVEGPLRLALLRRAWEDAVQRHPILRTGFVWEGVSEPLQVVLDDVELPWREEDWRGRPAPRLAADLARLIAADEIRGFDPASPLLTRVTVVRTGEQTHELVWSFHHLLLDGWSAHTLLGEVSRRYAAALTSQPAKLAAPPPYRDYIAHLSQGDAEAEAFWRERLKGFTSPTPLGLDHRSAGRQEPFLADELTLSASDTAVLQAYGRRLGVTLSTVLQGVWALLLSRYSGTDDVVFGAAWTVRPAGLTGVGDMVGLFLNTLPVRVAVPPGSVVSEWLPALQREQAAVRDHEQTPLVDLQRWSDLPRGTALFDSLMVFENYPGKDPFGALREHVRVDGLHFLERTNYPLTIAVFPGEQLRLRAMFDSARLGPTAVRRILGHIETVLRAISSAPTVRLGDLDILPPSERRTVVEEWNATERPYPADATLTSLLEDQARRTPEAPALRFESEELSFRELHQRANRLAHHLRGLGVGPNLRVGLCAERSVEMVVGQLAILKAGGAYVPLDPEYPADRLTYLFEDAAPAVLLTVSGLLSRLPHFDGPVICLDALDDGVSLLPVEAPEPFCGPDDLAYVIYTSGSTGKPKGALNTHRGIVNRLLWGQDRFALSAHDTVLQKTPFSFDISVWEFFWPLSQGARLVLAKPGGHRDPEYLRQLIQAERVTIVHFVPSMLQAFLSEPVGRSLDSVRDVLCSGEALSPELVRAFFRQADAGLHNLYGPTEAAIEVTCWTCRREDGGAAVPIGHPIANTRLYVLDEGGKPSPVGVPGELFIGGVQVGRGYWHRPELTAQRFVPDPFSQDAAARLYRTGDLARWREDGAIEYLGRLDFQVKLRGYRIELGEIETALAAHPDVREAVVLCREDRPGEKHLVAYLVPGHLEAPPTAAELRPFLRESLPDYMVPAVFVVLAALPVTVNGKLDRKALPVPLAPEHTGDRSYVAPRSEREALLARIWADVLRVDRVGVYDNYHELGGDSILSIQIAARAREAGLKVGIAALMKHPTIDELASALGEAPIRPGPVETGLATEVPLTPIQRWFFELNPANRHHWNQTFLFRTNGRLEAGRLRTAAEAVIAHHDALRLRFTHNQSEWRQRIGSAGDPAPFWLEDLSTVADADLRGALAAITARAAASLDLERGPMLRLVLIRLGESHGDRLLIVVHHLVVDGVSWRIILEDLERAYRDGANASGDGLPPKTTSWGHWATALARHADQPAGRAERAHWLAATEPPLVDLPLDGPRDGSNTVAESATVVESLRAEETTALLQRVPATYATQINDVLLTALAEALQEWTGPGELLLDLEGHGREDVMPGADLSRTVGWFTTVFPVRIPLDGTTALGARLKAMKERLRAIPGRGIGYGLLRYLGTDPEYARRPQAAVLFNYLGQFDQLVADSSLFRFAREDAGPWLAPEGRRRHALEINALVLDGRLEFRWTYGRRLHEEATIRRVALAMNESLRGLIRHALTPGTGGRTPSDFPLIRLTQEQTDRLAGTGQTVEDIAPLAPMQSLFLAASAGRADLGFEQWRFELTGELDVGAFQQAWSEVTARHAILRTGFIAEGLPQPVQVTQRRAETPFAALDWRDASPGEQASRFAVLLAEDRRRGFTFDQPPLFRITLVRTGLQAWSMVWSNHHLLLDRWSWPIVLREVGAIYQARMGGREPGLRSPTPWRRYLAWLTERDAAASERFWRTELAGLDARPLVAFADGGGSGGERQIELSAADTAALGALARERRVSVNTLISMAWGLWLAGATHRNDVVFGLSVSGRPEEIHGIAGLVGMCINNAPVRLLIDPDERVSVLAARLRDQRTAAAPHEHASPVDLQRWSGLSWHRRLFDSLLVFHHTGAEDDSADWLGPSMQVRMLPGEIQTNYPLALVVGGGDNLTLRLAYQGRFLGATTADGVLEEVRGLLASLPEAFDAPASGLLSRRARPVEAVREFQTGEGTPPRSDLEWVVAHLWTEVLGRGPLALEDNFFDLGGQSLAATQIVARTRDTFQMDLPVSVLFAHPTVAAFAAAIGARDPEPGLVERIAAIVRRIEEMSLDELREAGARD